MSLIDLVFVLIIVGFAMFGYWFGAVHTLGSLIGTLLGSYVAGQYYLTGALWLGHVTGWSESTTQLVAFAITFFVVNRIIGFLFWIVDKVTGIFTSLPFLSGINQFLGAILGLVEGTLTLGLLLFFVDKVPLSPEVTEMLAMSQFAPHFIAFASVLMPLLPGALTQLHSTFTQFEGVFRSTTAQVIHTSTSTP